VTEAAMKKLDMANLQATSKGLAQVLNNLINTDASHGSNGKSTDEGVVIL
jgi:hypothetical protein